MCKRFFVVFLIGLFMVASTGCAQKSVDPDDMANRLLAEVDRSLDDYLVAMGDEALEQLLKLNTIQYGSFTEVGSDEMLVTFKFVDVPHAGGLDRTLVLICDAKSFDAKMQKTFMADSVTLHLLDGVDSRSEILYIGSVTYQGYTVYGIERFDLSGGDWTEAPIFENGVGERDAFFYSDGLLQVFELTYEEYVPVYKHIRTLFWDSVDMSFSETPN